MREFNSYEVEMYNFLSKPENFENMLLVINQFELVKQMLIIDFWENFSTELKKVLIESEGWEVVILKGKGVSVLDWKVRVNKNSWLRNGNHEITFGWESYHGKWFYGVIVNNSLSRHKEIHSGLQQYAAKWNGKYEATPSEWYPFWNWVSVDLSKQSELVKLLPEKRKDLVQDCVKFTSELYKDFGAEIESVLNNLE